MAGSKFAHHSNVRRTTHRPGASRGAARAQSTSSSSAAPSNPLARFLTLLGPGLIAGAADDDPTGIATYAQAGARTGYGLLWTALLTLPMMIAAQYLATKVAAVEDCGLAGIIRRHYGKRVLYAALGALIVANLINAAVDIGAIAAAVNLVFPIPRRLLIVPVGLVILAFMVFGTYNLIETVFKWLTLALLAYIVSSFLAHPNVGAMLGGTFIPHLSFNPAFLALFVAALGGNVSPYLFFWQSDLEVAGERQLGIMPAKATRARRRRHLRGRLRDIAWDTAIGMIFSNVIIYFVEVATAATLFTHGITNVTSASQAAAALRPLLGNAATVLWAVGMIGAGILAVPALTGSAANAVAAARGWQHGLGDSLGRARHFYAVLAAAVAVAMILDFLPINPIQGLVFSAVVNGMLAPPLLVLLLLVANRKDTMGTHTNDTILNITGWATVAIMSLAALGLIITLL